jgi:hypothetical protein
MNIVTLAAASVSETVQIHRVSSEPRHGEDRQWARDSRPFRTQNDTLTVIVNTGDDFECGLYVCLISIR